MRFSYFLLFNLTIEFEQFSLEFAHPLSEIKHFYKVQGNYLKITQFTTDELELSCSGFLIITYFLERILMEHMGMKNSLESKLLINSICSIRIRSRK